MDYEPMGGGGTEFMVNWDYMKEHQIQPKKFIMFTDGYPYGSWGDELYCDTVFIIHGNNTIVPPFGEHAITKKLKKLHNGTEERQAQPAQLFRLT
jgi:predicted metal-dependent peptidase